VALGCSTIRNLESFKHLNNIGRGLPLDHFCNVWAKSNEQFSRRCLSENVDDAQQRTTEEGQRLVTIAQSE